MARLNAGNSSIILSTIIIISLAITSACGPTGEPGDGEDVERPLQVAFIYNGPIGDQGWIFAHDQGRRYLEETLENVETTYVENVAEGPEAERIIQDFAIRGYDLIFTTTHGFGDATLTVAQEFPEIYFEHATGYEIAPNVSTYFGRAYQARFLSGLVAGKMTQSNTIGYVAAFPIPQVVRGINGFARGVQAANPEARVHVVWTRDWFDPVLEREAAESLVNIGADVIAQHQNSAEPQKVAEERGVWGIGYNTDMSSLAPNAVLTSVIWTWGPYYVDEANAVINGSWTSRRYWGGLEDGIVGLAPFHESVPQEVRDLVEEWQTRIIETEWDVFTGPLYAQDRTLILEEGEVFSDEYLHNEMDWFVHGVLGEAAPPPRTNAENPIGLKFHGNKAD